MHLRFYEIEHTTNPLIHYAEPMRNGRLLVSNSVVSVVLYFANGDCLSFDTSSNKVIDIGDKSHRYWWRLHSKSYYDQTVIQRIAHTKGDDVVAQPTLYEMLYDLIQYKILHFQEYKIDRTACAHPAEVEENAMITAEECETWAQLVFNEGWERTECGTKLTC